MRVGFGFDSHRLVEGRRLVLGGVEVPSGRGALGHSDADALVHAIVDAVLGALGEPDIGTRFPDTDERYRDIDSIKLLRTTLALAADLGMKVVSVDCTVVLEAPKLAPHIGAMKEALAAAGLPAGAIGLKAKSNEGMGFIGRGEGVAAFAVCLLSAA